MTSLADARWQRGTNSEGEDTGTLWWWSDFRSASWVFWTHSQREDNASWENLTLHAITADCFFCQSHRVPERSLQKPKSPHQKGWVSICCVILAQGHVALCCYLITVHIESHTLAASIEVNPELLQLLIWWLLHLGKHNSSGTIPRKNKQTTNKTQLLSHL